MENVSNTMTHAGDRMMLVKIIKAILMMNPELTEKVWNVYIHPEDYKITIVCDGSIIGKIQDLFKWVDDFEARSFEECVDSFTPDIPTRRRKLGFTTQEIQARCDFYEILKEGLPAVFPSGLRGIGIDMLSERDHFIFVEVCPEITDRVSHLLSQMGPIAVTVCDTDQEVE